jgi:uncharacterized protein (DUF488 family)
LRSSSYTAELGGIKTIGHSTRTIEEFIEILKAHSVEELVDIRTIPRSRHNPQFNRETLPGSLAAAGISYRHMPGLGGLRRPSPDSVNTGWRNASFRGYADYMQTAEFEASLEELMDLARAKQVTIMCAEAVEFRCHRSLVADALTVRGIPVEHIQSVKRAKAHRMTPFAEVNGTRIVYREERDNCPAG